MHPCTNFRELRRFQYRSSWEFCRTANDTDRAMFAFVDCTSRVGGGDGVDSLSVVNGMGEGER